MKMLESITLALLALVAESASHQLTIQNHQLLSGSSSVSLSHDTTSNTAGSIFAGFVLGPLVFICSFICIWFNQKRAAIDERRLKLGKQICETVDVTSEASARSKDGRLVYANGVTRTSAIIGDTLSGVNGPNLIKITRKIQVLQWRKHTRKNGNYHQTYYTLQWCASNSQNQGERFNNPANWFINNQTIYNQQVYLGGYNVSKDVADLCNKSIPFTPNMSHAQSILSRTNQNKNPSLDNQYIYFSPLNMMGIASQGTLRVKYILCPTGEMSLIGQSYGPSFSKFNIAKYEGTQQQSRSSVPDCCCCLISKCYAQLLKPLDEILQVRQKMMSKDQIFDQCIAHTKCFSWTIRILAYLTMVLGIYLFFSPIVNILNYIPLVGGLISGIVGFAILLAALLICIPLWLITVAIAWLFYHPKVGLILIGIALAILGLIIFLGRNKGGGDGNSTATAAHFLTLHY